MGFLDLFKSSPAPPGFGAGQTVPEERASWLSKVAFLWLGPFLNVGYSRPLEEDDLWELPPSHLADETTSSLESNFYLQCAPHDRPLHLRESHSGSETPSASSESLSATIRDNASNKTAAVELVKVSWFSSTFTTRSKSSQHDSSLSLALYRTFLIPMWIAAFFKLCSDTLKTTTPLLTRIILAWLVNCYTYYRLSEEEKLTTPKPEGVGYGIGLAIALFVMQEASSLMANHYLQSSMITGLSMRTATIGVIFRKSLRISGRARLEHPTGQITTMISTDATRLDRFSMYGHNLWAAPVQVVIAICLLIANLGYSGLVGLGIILLGLPIQFILVNVMQTQRKKGVKITDARVRLTTEVLQGIRLLKFYAWETFYMNQIGVLRAREVAAIQKSSVARSTLIAIVTLIPILASVLSFITYALSGHDLNIAIIFSSLQIFNNIRAPLKTIPYVLANLSDTLIGVNRISKFLTAEELGEPYIIDYELKNSAIQINGSFTWEIAGELEGQKSPSSTNEKGRISLRKTPKNKKIGEKDGISVANKQESCGLEGDIDVPFQLNNLKMNVAKGAFVAIIGNIGSGKSSLLQTLIGEMRKTKGKIVLSGSVAYAPQTPWIRNMTLRENIIFSRKDDDERFHQIVRACHLEHDINMLPYGERTEIGEKGINLSGGQRARVSLARAAYSQADIVLLDDPLSAIDPYVGKAILNDCLLNGPLANRTRILVTHALHVLDKTDYIYIMENGVIIEEGTYESLLKNSAAFSRLIDEYGNNEQDGVEKKLDSQQITNTDTLDSAMEERDEKNATFMQKEERSIGAVSWNLYVKYLRFAGGIMWGPFIILLLILTQGAQVGNTLFLGYWTSKSVPGFKQGDYVAVYAAFGIAQAIFSFILSFSFSVAGLTAGINLFSAGLSGVLLSPTSFFDTTPIGRVISRLSKDQDTLDIELATTLWKFLSTLSAVLGTAALVFYTLPLLGISFIPMFLFYSMISVYYRRSSVETKRLESIIRSVLYGSYSETLTGLSTIRAYKVQDDAVKSVEKGLNRANKAYYMTISIQRWLAVRLDLIGNVLIFGIILFAVELRNVMDPARIGVVLTFTLSLTQAFSEIISQFAQNEQNMNAVERVVHYSELPPEDGNPAPLEPPMSWPNAGRITFKDVQMAYRDGLPLVLKNINLEVKPGEKVGIVGRTGAGKSSILQALFRIAELQGGTINIDGYDISQVKLDLLRSRLALVPQESTLFLGTLRENLDPLRLRTDAELISVLQRVWLLPKQGSVDAIAEAKFSLDSVVSDEGTNFSAGEKQLLSLARALVKNSCIIVLDEATSSVDLETDGKIQKTIQSEFHSSTLLCIAHRLKTIAYYDRVLVMDAGKAVEFDTVLNLFDDESSIFRSLCNDANLQKSEILQIREAMDLQIK